MYNHANANHLWYEALNDTPGRVGPPIAPPPDDITSNLKRDMPGEVRRIASFLDMPINEARWDAISEHCSFDWMKKNATRIVPLGGAFCDAGAAYEARAHAELGAECARWLATGEGAEA